MSRIDERLRQSTVVRRKSCREVPTASCLTGHPIWISATLKLNIADLFVIKPPDLKVVIYEIELCVLMHHVVARQL